MSAVRQKIVVRQEFGPDYWLCNVGDDETSWKFTAQVFEVQVKAERAVALYAEVVHCTQPKGCARAFVVQEGSWEAADVGTAVDEEPPLSDLVGDKNATACKLAARGRLYGLPVKFP